jgi:hypothetical protein
MPNYPDGITIYGSGAPFELALEHKEDRLGFINILSPEIKTAAGISLGSTLAQLTAAYPTFAILASGPLTNLYVLNGTNGQLVFEVGKAGAGLGADENRVVNLWIRTRSSTPPGSIFDNDAGGGICPGGA